MNYRSAQPKRLTPRLICVRPAPANRADRARCAGTVKYRWGRRIMDRDQSGPKRDGGGASMSGFRSHRLWLTTAALMVFSVAFALLAAPAAVGRAERGNHRQPPVRRHRRR